MHVFYAVSSDLCLTPMMAAEMLQEKVNEILAQNANYGYEITVSRFTLVPVPVDQFYAYASIEVSRKNPGAR